MRNDARPVGHDAPGDPVGAPDHERTHDRPSHVVDERAEENVRRDAADAEPALPANDATLKTKI